MNIEVESFVLANKVAVKKKKEEEERNFIHIPLSLCASMQVKFLALNWLNQRIYIFLNAAAFAKLLSKEIITLPVYP